MNKPFQTFLFTLAIGASFSAFASTGQLMAHETFQDVLKEKYGLKSFSCKTCHPVDDKKVRTPFADLYAEALKDGNWSAKYAEAEKKGEAEVKEFEKVIAEEFKKKLDEVGKKSLSVDQLFASGLLAGIRIDEKKKAAGGSGNGTKAGESKESDKEKPADDKAPSTEKPAPSSEKPSDEKPLPSGSVAVVRKDGE